MATTGRSPAEDSAFWQCRTRKDGQRFVQFGRCNVGTFNRHEPVTSDGAATSAVLMILHEHERDANVLTYFVRQSHRRRNDSTVSLQSTMTLG